MKLYLIAFNAFDIRVCAWSIWVFKKIKLTEQISAEIFTVEYIGTTEGANPSFGDVSAALRKETLVIPHGLLMRLPYKRP